MNIIKPSQAYINRGRAKELLAKWDSVLNFENKNVAAIEDDHTRLSTAVLLENQEQWCFENTHSSAFFNSPGNASTFGSQGDIYAPGNAQLPKILIPMIRRTFPELISNEIVGVQPMGGPVGLAVAMRYKYETEPLGNGIDGKGDAGAYYQRAAGDVSSTPYDNAARAAAAGSGNWGADQPQRVQADYPIDPANPGKVDGLEAGYQYLDTRFTGASAAGLSGLDNGDFDILDEDKGIGELMGNFELTGKIPQMTVTFEKTAVTADTRRLAARWSQELEQDLKNMNGIDVDTEITNAMSYEIQAEIDREMLMRMVQVALNAGLGNGYSTWTPASADARWMAERNRDLYAKIIVEANRIAVRNRRGAANFLVATPKVCAILEMLPDFQWMQVQGNISTQPVGIARVGNLGGRFNVYRDTRTEAQSLEGRRGDDPDRPGYKKELNYVLLGYKGPEFYDTGIIYCPYIPVMVQRTVGPNDFSQRVGLMTRYGVVDNIFGASLYYHVIIVKDLGTGFSPGTDHVYM
jgi:hypothetical protein